jgi:uracil-DNA glycosylase
LDSLIKEILLEKSWKYLLNDEFTKSYMQNLKKFLVSEIKKNKIIYPKGQDIFRALNSTPFDKVKVVIIGQDPYHGPEQAHGLSFSVKKHISIPPSLRNIFIELKNDLNIDISSHGCLLNWAEQGVLLLNNILTVEKNKPLSHSNIGWEKFTDKILAVLNDLKKDLIFILWGRVAQNKAKNIDANKHLILKSPHPSPFSAYNGFFGSKHFSKTNNFLMSKNKTPINWRLSDNI